MEAIDTKGGEQVIVAAHGHDSVLLSVRCPRFGGISRVRLSHDQVASLAGALAGIALEAGAAAWRQPDEV